MSYFNYYRSAALFHGSIKSMATQLDMLVMGNETDTLGAWKETEMKLLEMEKLMSCHDPHGTLFHVNETFSQYPVELDDELWNIVKDCERYHKASNGLFDVTLGKFDNIILNEDDHTIYSFSESARIDLGGYGKGYALERIKNILLKRGFKQAFINFGNSSALALGHHPCGDYWPVGIENPYTHKKIDDIKLCDRALSVSGNAPRHENHIINPLTGRYADSARITAIVSEDAVEAEVLSTAFMIANEKQQKEIANNFDKISEKHIYTYEK